MTHTKPFGMSFRLLWPNSLKPKNKALCTEVYAVILWEYKPELLLAPAINYPLAEKKEKEKKKKTAFMQILSQCADSSLPRVLGLQFGVKCVSSLGNCLL